MRIALISDIHANFVALETVLADIERARVDQIVCLGDVVAGGPQPRETLQRVRKLGCPIVCGNTDEWFFVPQTYDPSSEKERRLMAMLEWAMNKFSPDDIAWIQSFQPRIEITLENKNTLLGFHGSPQSNTDIILASTSDDELARMSGKHHATIMAGGHTHTQMLRRFRNETIINPGSVGMPMQRSETGQVFRPPWSEYAVVDSRNGNSSVEFRRVPLDVDAVIRAAHTSDMPHVDFWVGEWTS